MKWSLLALLFCADLLWAAESQKSVQEILGRASAVRSEDERMRVYSELSETKPTNSDEVEGLYSEMKSVQKRYRSENTVAANAQMERIHSALGRTTAPAARAKVAELLEKEFRAMPGAEWEPTKATTLEEARRRSIQLAPLHSLMEAAGASKAEAALPALRKLSENDGFTGGLAIRAIGRIGKSEDLDRLIERIKVNPKARIDLSTFGGVIIDRIMREVDDPTTPEDQRNELIAHLGQAAGPENASKYFALIHHKNPRVVRMVSQALAQGTGKGNEAALAQMLADNSSQVRFSGLVAIQGDNWSPAFIPRIQEMLAKDGDESVREEAALVLGRRKLSSAMEALQTALSDPSRRVRGAAQVAIDEISGKAQQDIDHDVQEILKRAGKK